MNGQQRRVRISEREGGMKIQRAVAKRFLVFGFALTLVLSVAPAARATDYVATFVDDARPGASSGAYGYNTMPVGDGVYFSGDDGVNGRELWWTDGSTSYLVEDVNPGPTDSAPQEMVALGDALIFTAYAQASGWELWRAEGHSVSIVREIMADELSGSPGNLTKMGDYVYFQANNGTTGSELWRTDGTEAGTQLVKDLYPGDATTSSSPQNMVAAGGMLFFTAYRSDIGWELWRSDGTSSGTVLVSDIWTGPDSSQPVLLTAAGSTVYFSATQPGPGRELYQVTGTNAPAALDEINPTGDGSFSMPGVFGGEAYFGGGSGDHTDLYRVHANQVELVHNFGGGGRGNPNNFAVVGTNLYFQASDGASDEEHGYELFKFDGTTVSLAADIRPGTGESYPWGLLPAGDALYFVAYDGTSSKVYRYADGVATAVSISGTNTTTGCECNHPIWVAGDRIWFHAYSDETGWELAYVTEESLTLPSTNREAPSHHTAVLIAALAAAASLTLSSVIKLRQRATRSLPTNSR